MKRYDWLLLISITLFGVVLYVVVSALDVVASNPKNNSNVVKYVDGTKDTLIKSTNYPQIKLHELDLSSNRYVYIFGEIDENLATSVIKQLLLLSETKEPITIIINSPGGSVIDGAAIISAMEAAKGPVNTVCTQMCASMAAMIFSYGTERMMLNRSLLMEHPASIGGVSGELDKAYSRLAVLKRYIRKMEEYTAKRAKMTYEQYKLETGVELWLDAEDAINRGFADRIVFVRGPNATKLFIDPILMRNKQKRNNFTTLPSIGPNNPFQFNWF